jgi:glycosyltransferase involved in cell wall biosynthesis
MKLAFVSDFYYPSIGGTQMLCKGLAEWFRDQGCEIEIITSPDSNRGDLGYPIHEIKGASFEGYNLLLEQNYDTVFVFADLFSPTLNSMNAGNARKSILILNLDENVYRWIEEGRIKDVAQRVEKIKRFSHVVSFCQGAPVNKFLDENGIKHHFIPNFSRDVKNGPISNKITKEALGITKKIIFNHGLIETRKNQLNLMKSFLDSGLSHDHHLVLLGSPRSGGDMKYFLECKRLCDSSDSITMIKGTNNQTIVNSLLNISDLYVLPSTAEGLPLVLLEAMSAGLPWVSTPVGGVPAVFGPLNGGKILRDFSLSDLGEVVRSIDTYCSREDWENNFEVSRAGNQYSSLLNLEEDSTETIDYLKKHKISFANQVYNEPEAIGNYLRSCLQFAGIVDEVYVIDHRSSDNTLEIIKSFQDQYRETGINLRWKTEPRDFSKDFTIADVFGDAVKECSNEIVFRHDADFIFGNGYLKTMEAAVKFLNIEKIYACGYEIPVVSDFVKFADGEIVDYGFCNMHVSVPRVFKKSKTKCLQNHVGGKYEWFYPTDKDCSQWVTLPHFRQSLLSVNVKDVARQKIRETMNTFMEDLQQGKVHGNWLDNNDLRREKEDWADENAKMKKVNITGERYEF